MGRQTKAAKPASLLRAHKPTAGFKIRGGLKSCSQYRTRVIPGEKTPADNHQR